MSLEGIVDERVLFTTQRLKREYSTMSKVASNNERDENNYYKDYYIDKQKTLLPASTCICMDKVM